MNKEVKKEFKKIAQMALNGNVEKACRKKHHKWRWKMKNKFGKICTCQVTLPKTPSDWRWKMNHHGNIRKILRNLDIEGYRIQ